MVAWMVGRRINDIVIVSHRWNGIGAEEWPHAEYRRSMFRRSIVRQGTWIFAGQWMLLGQPDWAMEEASRLPVRL